MLEMTHSHETHNDVVVLQPLALLGRSVAAAVLLRSYCTSYAGCGFSPRLHEGKEMGFELSLKRAKCPRLYYETHP